MGECNRVTVKIAGQEYTISGEMSREHIMRVADYVDSKMGEIAKLLPNASSVSQAVLTAVNAADDYFAVLEEARGLKNRCAQLEKDSAHYVQLWDEAKKNFLQYKENAQSSLEHRDQLQKLFNEKTVEYSRLSDAYEELKRQNEEMKEKLAHQEASGVSCESAELISQLENKCKDIESSFFDLQMENIRLKGELDQFKKNF